MGEVLSIEIASPPPRMVARHRMPGERLDVRVSDPVLPTRRPERVGVVVIDTSLDTETALIEEIRRRIRELEREERIAGSRTVIRRVIR